MRRWSLALAMLVLLSLGAMASVRVLWRTRALLEEGFATQGRVRGIARVNLLIQRAESLFSRARTERNSRFFLQGRDTLEAAYRTGNDLGWFDSDSLHNLGAQLRALVDSASSEARFYQELEKISIDLNSTEVEAWYHFSENHHDLQTSLVQEHRIQAGLYGLIILLLGVSVWLTLRRRAVEALLRERDAEMAARARLVSLGEMASGVAHELNTPLQVILGYSEEIQSVARERNSNLEVIRGYASKLAETAVRAGGIIKSMRQLTRNASADPFKLVPLSEVIQPPLDILVSHLGSESVALSVEGDAASIHVECRPSEVAQVLLNLINNSLHAISKLSEKWIKIQVAARQTHAEIAVIDSGHGIPPEIRKKLFIPMFTTKSPDEGTGLGLSIGVTIIHQHGGRLYYDEFSRNTRFVFELPYRQPGKRSHVKI